MTGLSQLTRRNLRLFFKDKGMFITSLITPAILLVLYATFLANVYKDSFLSSLPQGFSVNEKIIDATVAGQLIASLLAVSSVTVSFCSNMLMINDKANGAIRDLTVSPLKRSTLAISYYVAAALSTLIVAFCALAICLAYLSTQGWYLTAADVLCVMLDVLLLTLFGTSLSSCIHFFLSTNGQASAVGTIVSAGYGFICGAYMPISSFSDGLQKVLSFLPGTYGTALIKNHMLRGVFEEMRNTGFPTEAVDGMRKAIDCDLSFFSHNVPQYAMYFILIGAILFFTMLFITFNLILKGAHTKSKQ